MADSSSQLKAPLVKAQERFVSEPIFPDTSIGKQSRVSSEAASTCASEADRSERKMQVTTFVPKELDSIAETRGWKHFFRHKAAFPLALGGGILLGVVGTLLAVAFVGPALQSTEVESYEIAPPASEVPPAYLAAAPLDNSCLISQLKIPEGPQTFDACDFVIRSTDEVWNKRGTADDVNAAIDKYFHKGYVDAGSWGRRIIGLKGLREAVFSEMRAFPDIQIHITDCACKGNDIDGYKCAMPDVLTGTNTGPSGWGPATGKYARWTGMVQSFVKKNAETGQWQYVAEWGVHDEWSIIQQLGLDFAKVPHPARNDEPLHDCTPLLAYTPRAVIDAADKQDQEEHYKEKAAAKRLRAGH
eukprot:TRINITY_DN8811_c0_g1_i2.p1 TRINITY_DN8811_c0_g1~~TRINITY_DN8811_c0_g1_i2.p1  ORF type:complete len:358 (+),score=82.39 TRINITY_DN8811_c0_g1_i2:73-1146(+)